MNELLVHGNNMDQCQNNWTQCEIPLYKILVVVWGLGGKEEWE